MLIEYKIKATMVNICYKSICFVLFLNEKFMQLIISERVAIIVICGKNIIIKYYETSIVNHVSSK